MAISRKKLLGNPKPLVPPLRPFLIATFLSPRQIANNKFFMGKRMVGSGGGDRTKSDFHGA